MRDGIERTRAEQVRRARFDLISTSAFPNISSAAVLRRFVRGMHPDQQGPTVGGVGGVVTHHHHHILGSSMALWTNGISTVLLAETTPGCCNEALENGVGSGSNSRSSPPLTICWQ